MNTPVFAAPTSPPSTSERERDKRNEEYIFRQGMEGLHRLVDSPGYDVNHPEVEQQIHAVVILLGGERNIAGLIFARTAYFNLHLRALLLELARRRKHEQR